MPCDDGRGSGDGYRLECEQLKRRVDELAQNLCYLCANLMEAGILEKYTNPRILTWHKIHIEDDDERVRRKMMSECNKDKDMLNDSEKMAEKFISLAEAEHPVSNWHKNWFYVLAREVAQQVKEEKASKIERERKRRKVISRLTGEEKELLNL